MLTWLKNKLAAPLLPVLEQTYNVVIAIEPAINDIISKAAELGISNDSPILATLNTIKNAVSTIKDVVVKTIEFFGGEIPVAAQGTLSLENEIEKLKKLI